MKYKIESVKNSKIIYSSSENATHPNQVIRRAVASVSSSNYFIYLLSYTGLIWVYYIDEYQRARLITKNEIVGLDLDYIKSGNKLIYEVVEK